MNINILFFLMVFLLPLSSFAQSVNTGLIEGIWFSKDVYTVGENIRIYTAVQNNSGSDVSGEVHFFDNGETVSIEPFTVLDNRIAEVWTDTVAVEGEHIFTVSVEQLKANSFNNGEEFTPKKRVSRGTVLVIRDNDGDGIADDEDKDDDNDGFSDNAEKRQGTDPLDENSVPEITEEEQVTESFFSLGDTAFDEDISGEVPKVVQNFSEELPLIKPVIGLINTAQNKVVEAVDREYEEQTDQTEKAWYYQALPVLSWIFSCFWCASILLLTFIYLLIKLTMKIIRRF